eukprot:GHVP01054334.1.p1 GENE.GHVP01054334.1~~GHVP01054334.1.p1  ORF type:complete len:332 (+),score=81.23 GHVP01054334.1:352-1347(+)
MSEVVGGDLAAERFKFETHVSGDNTPKNDGESYGLKGVEKNENGDDIVRRTQTRIILADGTKEVDQTTGIEEQGGNNKMSRALADDLESAANNFDEIHMQEHPKEIQKTVLEETLKKISSEQIPGKAGYTMVDLVRGGNLSVTSAGSSGLYLFRDGIMLGFLVDEATPSGEGDITAENSGNMKQELFNVQRGDIVLVCSSGITENLYREEIVQLVTEAGKEVAPLADKLVQAAAEKTKGDRPRNTPFGDKERKKIVRDIPVGLQTMNEKIENCRGYLEKGEEDESVIGHVIQEYRDLVEGFGHNATEIETADVKAGYGKPGDMTAVIALVV